MLLETPQQKIELKGKQKDAWYYLNDNKTTEIFYGGAAGGGKSFLGCLWHIDRRIRYPGTRGMIGRSEISTLEQSTLKTFFDVAKLMGHERGYSFTYNEQKHFIRWANGSETYLKDLVYKPGDPEFTSLGSTEYTDIFIDEGTEIRLKAFDIANSRIRYKLDEFGLVPKIFVTCNPAPGWIKNHYLIDPNNNQPIRLQPYQKFVKAKVTDNPKKEFIKLYSDQLSKMHSEYDIQRLLHGNWDAQSEAQNPFAYALNELIHFDRNVFIEAHKPVFIQVDFNLSPFASLTANIYRDHVGLHVYFVGEVSQALGSVPSMGERLRNIHAPYLHSLKMTGDALGKNRNITQVDNASNYEMLRRIMGLRHNQLVLPSNPLHETSRNDCNYLLQMACDPMNRVYVKINPDLCPNLARELKYTQCDENGDIIKKNRDDENQRADFLDCFRYCVNTFLKSEIERHQKQHFGKLRLHS